MTRSPRSTLFLAAVASLAVALGACTGGAGNAGTLVPRPTDNVPTDEPSATPSDQPSATPTEAPTATASPTAEPSPNSTPSGETMTVKAYFLQDDRLIPVQRTVAKSVATSRAAMGELLSGPTAVESAAAITSSIPDDTILLGLNLDHGVMTVDLSREFESGGGSRSMYGRLAQVVYTLTQFPTVDSVVFLIDGQPVTAFSGEGIVLDGPSVRSDYVAFLPEIFVDRPAWGGTLANPARITGLSDVFEATFRVTIKDAAGRTLVDQMAMSDCGSGCWGTFDLTIPYSVSSSQIGSLVVYDRSARDGTPENIRTYPVRLTP